jgi:small subunit ribosomal protein S16
MLTIRLQRTGKRNHSHFRVVLAEKESSVSKKFTEVLGSYNPHSKDLIIKDQDRLNYWITQRTDMSPTVHNLLVTKGILKADKVKAFNIPKKKEEAPVAAAPVAETTPEPEVPATTEAPVEQQPEEVKAE